LVPVVERQGWFAQIGFIFTAAKLDSKDQLRKETIPSIPTGTVTRMPLRQMLAAARSHQTPVLEEKPRSPEGAHEREGRSFTCPSAAVTTAATLGTKFERNIYTGQHGEFQSSVNIGPEDVRAFIERSNRSRSKGRKIFGHLVGASCRSASRSFD
jgi:hypothetical protein